MKIFCCRKNYSRRIKIITTSLVCFAIIISVGCSYNQGLVYRKWTKTMAQLGIYPVFPPKEDIQVGDVWALPVHPLETSFIEALGGLSLVGDWITTNRKNVDNFYKNRPSFPSSSDAIATAATDKDGNTIMKVPSSSDGSIFSNGDPLRLRQVAFPEFAVTNITQTSLNALIPVEFINVAGGLLFNDIEEVSLRIPSAESYGLPTEKLLQSYFENGTIKMVIAPEADKNGVHKKELWLSSYAWKNNKNRPGVPGLSIETAMLTRSNFNEKIRAIKDNKTGFSGFSEKTKLAKLLKRTKDYL